MPTREEIRSLAQDIVGSYEDRMRGIAQLQKDVSTRLQGFERELKEVRAARVSSSHKLRVGLAKSAADLKQEVHQEIEDVHAARAAASQELRAELAKGAADLKQKVGTLLKGFGMKLAEVRAALAGARDEWQKLAATMHEKRGEPGKVKAPPAEEALGTTPDLGAIRDRVFGHLANHPDGTRLVELEQEFGLSRIQMSRLVRTLTEENKVAKRGLLYFAM